RIRLDARPRAWDTGGPGAAHGHGAGEQRERNASRRALRRIQALRHRTRRRRMGARRLQRDQVHRADRMSFDTIINNGRVVDGSGLPKRVADVGIRGGIITDLGRLSGAKRVLDADGLVVMPGIIDAHTHYDPQLTFEPFATSSCFHGVTSVVGGNCGYSIAPVRPDDHDWVTKLFAKVDGMSPRVLGEGLPWDWESFPSLLAALDTRLGIN